MTWPEVADAATLPAVNKDRLRTFTYSNEAPATRVAAVFPDDLPIAEVFAAEEVKTAANEPPKLTEQTVATEDNVKLIILKSMSRKLMLRKSTTSLQQIRMPMLRCPAMPPGGELFRFSQAKRGSAVHDLDLLMAKLWEENNVKPVSLASDEELLRRVYLDLAGRTPSVNEVRDYLKNTSPDKYESLVNRLLNSPDHASHLAAKFRSFLLPEGVDLTNFGGVEAFEKWLAARFQKNEPYDKTVQGLLLAEGRLVQSGPLLFLLSHKAGSGSTGGPNRSSVSSVCGWNVRSVMIIRSNRGLKMTSGLRGFLRSHLSTARQAGNGFDGHASS